MCLSVLLLLAGLITYIWDINEALSVCYWQMKDSIPRCTPDVENCENLFYNYEPRCRYSNDQVTTAISVLLCIGGIFAITALSCYCYSINLTTPPPQKCCNNRCLWKAWASLATIGALFAVYSLGFFLEFSHYPAAKQPAIDTDGVYYAIMLAGAFTFLAVGMLLAIIGLVVLCCLRTDNAHKYEDVNEAINI